MKMKRFFCVFLVLLILSGFSSCSSQQTSTNGATEDEANYPKPEEDNYEESDNATSLRYDMTLWDYTTAFNLMYSDLGGGATEGISFSDWVLTEENQKDNNNVEYDSYYFNSGSIVLTATVETESEHVMNLGCGTTVAQFTGSAETQQEIMTLCGIMATVAGGYNSDAVTFFNNLFVDTIDSDENCFWYEQSFYLFSTEDKDDDDESTVLFRTIPAKAEFRELWNIPDYSDYWSQ